MTAHILHQEQFLNAFWIRRCSFWSRWPAKFLLALIISVSWASAVPLLAAEGDDRVALLLSVEDYSSYGKSAIDSNTVKKMQSALESQGFSVELVTNANNAVVRATLRDFAHKAEGARVAIVVLAGHGVGSGGRSYLLPSNAEIRRSSDLLSRGVAVASVAQIAGRADHGAVFFFMSAPDISSALQGISARPAMAASPSENVVVVFSTSEKVPVSRVGSVSKQAAADFADAASETPLMMSTLVGSASAGDVGKVIGTVADLDLSKAPTPEPPPQAAMAAPSKEEVEARREAERRAREAEERAKAAEARAAAAVPSAEEVEARREAERRARDAEERAKAAEARAREAEARAKLEEKRADDAQSAAAAGGPEAAPAPETEASAAEPNNVEALELVEALLGRSKKKDLQRRLRKLGYYTGPIDAVFGDLTRQSIKDYQRNAGAAVTGFLTPGQIQALIEGG